MVDTLKSAESTEKMKGKLKWTISSLSYERGIWQITSDDETYDFFYSHCNDVWDWVAEAFNNLNKDDIVTFDAVKGKGGPIAINIRLIEDTAPESEAIEQQTKGKKAVAWIISKSIESTEKIKGKLKWNISQLSRERGTWKINSDGKIYEFYFSACNDMWDWVAEAFNNLNKDDVVTFDAGPFSDRFRSTAVNIRVIDDVPQESKAIEQ